MRPLKSLMLEAASEPDNFCLMGLDKYVALESSQKTMALRQAANNIANLKSDDEDTIYAIAIVSLKQFPDTAIEALNLMYVFLEARPHWCQRLMGDIEQLLSTDFTYSQAIYMSALTARVFEFNGQNMLSQAKHVASELLHHRKPDYRRLGADLNSFITKQKCVLKPA